MGVGGERRERDTVSEGLLYTRACERALFQGAGLLRYGRQGRVVWTRSAAEAGRSCARAQKKKKFFGDGVRAAGECVFDKIT